MSDLNADNLMQWSQQPLAKGIGNAGRPSAFSRVLFTSKTDQWPTPQWFFDALDAEFGFDLDVCASPEHAKCKRYFTPSVDGLKQSWTGVCWMNPPYGREIGRWVAKAYKSAQQGATVVCLLPSRTDTAWWHEYVMRADEVRFLRGRLKFGNATSGAPFPSAVVIFRPRRPVIVSKSVNAPADQPDSGQAAAAITNARICHD